VIHKFEFLLPVFSPNRAGSRPYLLASVFLVIARNHPELILFPSPNRKGRVRTWSRAVMPHPQQSQHLRSSPRLRPHP
jgi:hypothetical protein